MKKTFFAEWAYLLGLLAIALGVALMEAADFGVSMVVAPAYLFYLKFSQEYAFVTFGMAEYLLQGCLLLLMILILRKFRFFYLFSFVTAVLYGFLLDGAMLLVDFIPCASWIARMLLYGTGMLACALGVSLMFHTYIAPEVYELFVKEVSGRFGIEIHRFKTGYDCVSCAVGVLLSFCFFGFGHFEGVKLGTILCALVNGWVIGRCSRFLESRYCFPRKLRFLDRVS